MLFLVATLTPFDARGRVDLPRLRAHVLWLAALGVDGFVPTGSAGELPYLTDREREAVHRTILDACPGKTIYPCTWDPSPQTTKYLTDAAREQGATGVLLPPPLYYRLPDDAIDAWYRSVHETSRLPILAWHDPELIPSTLSPERYLKLRAEGVLAGIKDGSGDAFKVQRLSRQDPGAVFAGGDRMLSGTRRIQQLAGVISSLANAWPDLVLRLLRGEDQLDEAVVERVNRVRAAGGLRALKTALGMGCRAPLPAPSAELMAALPATEYPR